MRKLYYAASIALVSFTQTLFAQSMPAGNLEPTTSATPCHFSDNVAFPTQMGGNAAAFSTIKQTTTTSYGTFEFTNASCNDGSPENGSWFLSMQWSDGTGTGGTAAGADAISFRVTPKMDTGHTYELQFYTKKTLFYPACKLAVGYSKVDTQFGSYIAVVAEPTDAANWTLNTYFFKPSDTCSWITVKADSTTMIGNFNYIDVDAFSLTDVTAVKNVAVEKGIQIFPNPLHNTARIVVDDNVSLPYKLSITDMTGRVIMHKENISNKEMSVSKSDFADGLYILRIVDNDNNAYTTKLIAE